MKYTIYGKVQQQERPRATFIKGRIRLYDPPKSKAYKQYVQAELKKQNALFTDKPIKMTMRIYVPIPKSYSKKQREAIKNKTLLAAKKPDLSNYIKLIEDASNGILYKDDNQIVELSARKEYSENPRIEIEIEEL